MLIDNYNDLKLRIDVLSNRISKLEFMATLQQNYSGYLERLSTLRSRVEKLEGVPATRTLIGGWRVPEEYALGSIAIDFNRRILWIGGNSSGVGIVEYDLPAMGGGTDLNNWPACTPRRTIGQFWPQIGDNRVRPYGLVFWRGKLWVAPRVYYAAGQDEAWGTLTIHAEDGDSIGFPSLYRQRHAGFVKRGPGLDPMIGSGGYSSGSNSSFGPTLATLSGSPLLPSFPFSPGGWDDRELRFPNYSVPSDQWFGMTPRNGVGKWCTDKVFGGGLILPEGICYWPSMGTGYHEYVQTPPSGLHIDGRETCKYVYDSTTYQLLSFTQTLQIGEVLGQEIDSAGRVYLCEGNQWGSPWIVNPTINVYE